MTRKSKQKLAWQKVWGLGRVMGSAAETNTGPVTLMGKMMEVPALGWALPGGCARHSFPPSQAAQGRGGCQVGKGAHFSQKSPTGCLIPLTWKGWEKGMKWIISISLGYEMDHFQWPDGPHKYINDFICTSAWKGNSLTTPLWELLLLDSV